MELLKSPLTDDELVKINKFYTLNKDILTLPENVTNLDTFIQSNEIFLEMLVELSRFEQTKAWMHLYKLVRSQNTKSQNLTANDKKSSLNNYLSIVITVVILFVIVIPAFYFFVIREPSKSDYEKCLENGVQYYKDIGSYPMLKSENISAISKAKDNCTRSTVAFGDIE